MIVDRARGNFSASELGCNCCGTIRVHEAFLDVMELLRERTRPLAMISCSRCQPHNLSVGGHKTSFHLIDNPKHLTQTIAGDINSGGWCDQEKTEVYQVAKELGLSMGLKENAFHLDYRELVCLPQKVFFYGYTPEWFA